MGDVRIPIYTVDAFTSKSFSGNPAGVCLISNKQKISENDMQKIAAEMNLSETAFITTTKEDNAFAAENDMQKIAAEINLPANAFIITTEEEDAFAADSNFNLRWFTPAEEVPLCGHATLASAAVLFRCLNNQSDTLKFETLSGTLFASRDTNGLITLDFPRNDPRNLNEKEFGELGNLIKVVVGRLKYQDVLYSPTTKKLLIRLDDSLTKTDLQGLQPSPQSLLEASTFAIKGVIVTLKGALHNGCVSSTGEMYDFVSRYFAPWVGIPEDPVTGSAHTVLGPYWSQILSKDKLFACQSSPRSGELKLLLKTGRIEICGDAVVMLNGQINL